LKSGLTYRVDFSIVTVQVCRLNRYCQNSKLDGISYDISKQIFIPIIMNYFGFWNHLFMWLYDSYYCEIILILWH